MALLTKFPTLYDVSQLASGEVELTTLLALQWVYYFGVRCICNDKLPNNLHGRYPELCSMFPLTSPRPAFSPICISHPVHNYITLPSFPLDPIRSSHSYLYLWVPMTWALAFDPSNTLLDDGVLPSSTGLIGESGTNRKKAQLVKTAVGREAGHVMHDQISKINAWLWRKKSRLEDQASLNVQHDKVPKPIFLYIFHGIAFLILYGLLQAKHGEACWFHHTRRSTSF